MSKLQSTTKSILRDANATLATAEYGLKDLIEGPSDRRLAGLRSLIVFGRAVTNVLQNLRNKEPTFKKWYSRYKEEMESDPLMKFFYDLRSVILKEGVLNTSNYLHILRLELPDDLNRLGPPPPNAKRFFIGDNTGRSGWEVELPDGSTQKHYVDLPSDIGSIRQGFPETPKSHLGRRITSPSIESLSTMYIDYLRKMVQDANKRFGKAVEKPRDSSLHSE